MSNEAFLDRTWGEIEPSVRIILGDEKGSTISAAMYTLTYSKVYDYCTTASTRRAPTVAPTEKDGRGTVTLVGAELYRKLQAFLKQYLSELNKRDDETFLQFYIRAWQRYLIGSTRLNDVLDYINRYWVTKERADGHREVYDILSLCLLSWRDYKFHTHLDTLMKEIMYQIRLQRENKIESTGNLSVAIKSFVLLGFDVNDLKKQNLSVYVSDFEKTFLTETYNFYMEESEKYIREQGVINYMIKAQARIDEESKRLEELNEHTKRPLNDVLNNVFIINHQEEIRSQLKPLLNQERYDDVSRMNVLLHRVPVTVDPLLEDFQAYVKQQGLTAVKELAERTKAAAQAEADKAKEEAAKGAAAGGHGAHKRRPVKHAHKQGIDAKTYVRTLLAVYQKFKAVVEEAFAGNFAFTKALESACQSFINKNPIATPTARTKSKTPDLLAQYADELLRKKDSAEDMSADELMTLFAFVDDKESFEIWYRRYLSKRLMNSTMTAEDEEREEVIIQKLKTANSVEYTSKITSMFTDIRLSHELGEKYKSVISNNHTSSASAQGYITELEPRILDSSSWSAVFKTPTESFILPKELIASQEKFETIYRERFSGRRLNWIWMRSRIELKVNNLSKPGKPPFHFTVTVFQYAILSAFNDNDTMTAYQLQELTALPAEVFKVNMVPFVKNKLLVQEPAGEDKVANPTTKFTIVKEYTSKRIKINFATGVRPVEARNEERETNEEVERRHHELLKACIVRIMKARKNLKHQRLTNEVFEMTTRFKPTVGEIKQAIEVLIDEQYLSRDEDGSTYTYLS